jgi:hypothetical protein
MAHSDAGRIHRLLKKSSSVREEPDPAGWSRYKEQLVKFGPRLWDHPTSAVWEVWKRLPPWRQFGSFHLRCALDLYPRPHYAFGVQQAALLARRLGRSAVAVVELGVAGGAGLLQLEQLAGLAASATGVDVVVFGFDRTVGLPAPRDSRDLPYHWKSGFFEMDLEVLERRLVRARLIKGELRDTVPEFIQDKARPPIGFVAVDVDLYSSTADGLALLAGTAAGLLPRVWCYFDDIVGEDWVLHNEYVGELRAIKEFNELHKSMKLLPVFGLSSKRPRQAAWCESMFALHRFDHPDYDRYIGPANARSQLFLKD